MNVKIPRICGSQSSIGNNYSNKIHSKHMLFSTVNEGLISSYYMQLYLYEASLTGGRVSSTTLLNLADVKTERYHQHQRFSYEELLRATERDSSDDDRKTRTTYGSKEPFENLIENLIIIWLELLERTKGKCQSRKTFYSSFQADQNRSKFN